MSTEIFDKLRCFDDGVLKLVSGTDCLAVTEDFGIIHGIFTITRDNATYNMVMLERFEEHAQCVSPLDVEHPWSCTVKQSDVRCMAHVINIAVQAALKTLQAGPAPDPN